jgi:hypothetical protein
MLQSLSFSKARANARQNPGHFASYLVILNIIIITISVALHELGHLTVGVLAGCGSGSIAIGNIINPVAPWLYSSLACPAPVNQGMITLLGLGGFLFIIPFALAFTILRKRPERNCSIIIIGISIVLAGLDLLLVVPHDIIVYIALAAGLAVMCAGEVFLAGDYTDYSAHRKHAKNTARRVSKRRQHNH